MVCPKCEGKVSVIDVRHDQGSNETYRQRKCTVCQHIFYTVEFEVETNDKLFKVLRYCK